MLCVRTHETRIIAPSLVFKVDFAADQVLKAGVWKSYSKQILSQEHDP